MKRIYISYNSSAQQEQSLALRLQTLSSLYGLHVSLPDRIGSNAIKDSTKERIAASELFIVFSTISLSKAVREEINFARSLRKKIIVVYDKDVPRNLELTGVKEIEYDRSKDSPDKVLNVILKEVHSSSPKTNKVKSTRRKKIVRKDDDTFAGFVLVGLGLLLLAAFMSGDKK
ncbi:MAG: hypothetical protein U0V64_03135 [Cyclobacteriaceae bacterium]